ncbi:MAG: YlbF family regulator [Bacillaceae bacterium]
MAMTINEATAALQEAVLASSEFKVLQQRFLDMKSDPSAKAVFDQLQQVQQEVQQKMMQGQQITPQEEYKMQQLLATAQQNPRFSALMQAEHSMNMLMNTINVTIYKPIEDLYKG